MAVAQNGRGSGDYDGPAALRLIYYRQSMAQVISYSYSATVTPCANESEHHPFTVQPVLPS